MLLDTKLKLSYFILFLVIVLSFITASIAQCQTQNIAHYAPSGKLVFMEQLPCPDSCIHVRCFNQWYGWVLCDDSSKILSSFEGVLVRKDCDCNKVDTLEYGCPVCGFEELEDPPKNFIVSATTCSKCGVLYSNRRRLKEPIRLFDHEGSGER